MFTGIIEQTGRIKNIRNKGSQANMAVQFQKKMTDLVKGESVAVNGVCLTVVSFGIDFFSADISEETLNRTGLGELKSNDMVNLERALKAGERLGGHLVSGHIDGIGHITKKIIKGQDILLTIEASSSIMKYIVEKGSIAVDGISLTVAFCDDKSFTISIIPHTEASTNLKWKKTGNSVNLENDMIGKYVEKFVNLKNQESEIKSDLSIKFLQKHGF